MGLRASLPPPLLSYRLIFLGHDFQSQVSNSTKFFCRHIGRSFAYVNLKCLGMYFIRSTKVGTLDWARPFPADAS